MNFTDAPEVTRELTVELTPPALESATVEGDRLTLTFDELLAEHGGIAGRLLGVGERRDPVRADSRWGGRLYRNPGPGPACYGVLQTIR